MEARQLKRLTLIILDFVIKGVDLLKAMEVALLSKLVLRWVFRVQTLMIIKE